MVDLEFDSALFRSTYTLVMLAAALSAVGCSNDNSCSSDDECFRGQTCREGTCIDDSDPDTGTPSDAGGTDAGDVDADSDGDTDAGADSDDAGGTDTCRPTTWYQNEDDDDVGTDEVTEEACTRPAGFVAESGDCDDTNGAIHPEADELCDGRDNDCDEETDEGFDLDGTCAAGVGVCRREGTVVCDGDMATTCSAEAATSDSGELCLDERDNDCDGEADEMADRVGVGFVSFDLGDSHICGLTALGEVYCWGRDRGTDGALGVGMPFDRATPTKVDVEETFRAIALGSTHTCGVTESGEIYCWGSDRSGQLGNGPDDNDDHAEPVAAIRPMSQGTPRHFDTIAATGGATCALTDGGKAYCWGNNREGRLGLGETDYVREPTEVRTPRTFQAIAMGDEHVCAITDDGMANMAEGRTYCWGNNSHDRKTGTLGTDSTDEYVTTPSLVRDEDGSPLILVDLAAGGGTTCGRTAGDELYCWGLNDDGQAGVDDRVVVPFPHPIKIEASKTKAIAVGMGPSHTCAVHADESQLYCWGRNKNDALGTSEVMRRETTHEPTLVDGAFHPYADAVGGNGRTCAITTSGQIYCWGMNGTNEDWLGVGKQSETTIGSPHPVVCPS